MGYVVEGAAYLGGVALIGAGLFLVLRGSFPGWWRRWFAWPLVRLTPPVSRLQGGAAILLGGSLIVAVFTSVAPSFVGGILVVATLAFYLVSVILFLFSTWLSRRPAAT